MCVVSVLSSDRIQQSMMCPLQNETQNHLLFDRENENETNCCIIITVPVRMLSAILCTLHGIYNTLSISSIEHWTICYLTCEIMIVMIIFVHGPFMRNRQSLIKLFLCAEFIQSFFFFVLSYTDIEHWQSRLYIMSECFRSYTSHSAQEQRKILPTKWTINIWIRILPYSGPSQGCGGGVVGEEPELMLDNAGYISNKVIETQTEPTKLTILINPFHFAAAHMNSIHNESSRMSIRFT